MQLNLLNQTTAVRRFAAAAQAATQSVLDFTVGSIYLALAQAVTSVVLWMQWLVLLVLATTRASTSNGADLDSWNADWSFTRLAAVAATGVATMSRYSATQPALIVPGVQIKTTDGSQTFTVTTDTTNPAWSDTAGAQPGYFLPSGVLSAQVPVQAVAPGAGGNIQPGTLTLLATGISGIDYATNASAFTNGINAESDDAYRARFLLFIGGLASAVPAAIEEAAYSVQQNVKIELRSNYPSVGFYTLYADDGSGAAPDSFIAAVFAAVAAETAEGVQAVVLRPTILPAAVSFSLRVKSEGLRPASVGAADAAVTAFIAALNIGDGLGYLDLPGVIKDSDPNILGVASLTLDGGTADVAAVVGQLITPATITGS